MKRERLRSNQKLQRTDKPPTWTRVTGLLRKLNQALCHPRHADSCTKSESEPSIDPTRDEHSGEELGSVGRGQPSAPIGGQTIAE